jgi:hypothetical protein
MYRLLPPPLASVKVSKAVRKARSSVRMTRLQADSHSHSQGRKLYSTVDDSSGFVGLYTGWLGKRNLGDDIVADIFLDLLAASIIEATDATTCVTLERSSRELADSGWRGCSMSTGTGCDFGVLGGGSLGECVYVYLNDLVREHSGWVSC